LIFCCLGEILACKLNAPGSWNDSRISDQIYSKLRDKTPDGFYLIADSAFPRGNHQIAGRIRAPIRAGDPLPSDENKRVNILAFDRQVLSYRQTAEWGNHTLQSAFARLRIPLPVQDHKFRANILEVCARLHNLRTRLIGLNQIRTVYMPLWSPTESEAVWDGLEDRLLPVPSKLAHFEAVLL
jgi:DDE superfamily endonuclease